jgi:hypothetical protein
MTFRPWRRGFVSIMFMGAVLSGCSSAPNLSDWTAGISDWWGVADYAPETGPVAEPPQVANYVTTDPVAFRNGPSSGIRIYSVLPPGTVVATDGRELNGWWGVDYQNVSGWIYGRYLRPQ